MYHANRNELRFHGDLSHLSGNSCLTSTPNHLTTCVCRSVCLQTTPLPCVPCEPTEMSSDFTEICHIYQGMFPCCNSSTANRFSLCVGLSVSRHPSLPCVPCKPTSNELRFHGNIREFLPSCNTSTANRSVCLSVSRPPSLVYQTFPCVSCVPTPNELRFH